MSIRGLNVWRRIFSAILMCSLSVLCACSAAPHRPHRVAKLSDYEPELLEIESQLRNEPTIDESLARSVQARLPRVQSGLQEALTWQEIDCFEKFWTASCVSGVHAQRRRLDERLTRLHLIVSRALRHASAIARAQAEAQRLSQ